MEVIVKAYNRAKEVTPVDSNCSWGCGIGHLEPGTVEVC